jgi:hypothetical protein
MLSLADPAAASLLAGVCSPRKPSKLRAQQKNLNGMGLTESGSG